MSGAMDVVAAYLWVSHPVRFAGQNMIVGGLAPTPLKKLKGARFATPSADKVDTQAIGRGVINRTIQE